MHDDVKTNSAGSIIAIALVFGLAYAVVRYHLAVLFPGRIFRFSFLTREFR